MFIPNVKFKRFFNIILYKTISKIHKIRNIRIYSRLENRVNELNQDFEKIPNYGRIFASLTISLYMLIFIEY